VNRTTRSTRASLVALALGGGLVLSACAGVQQVGAAAIVEDERMSMTRLQDLTESLLEAGGGTDLPEGEAQRVTLTRFIVSQVIEQAAQSADVTLTQGQIDNQRQQIVQAFGGEEEMRQGLAQQNISPAYLEEFVRDVALSDALGRELVPGDDALVAEQRGAQLNELLLETAATIEVEVNPRYGDWDPQQGQVTGSVSGGLARTPEQWLDPEAPLDGSQQDEVPQDQAPQDEPTPAPAH
jgi:hypothetical protein